jgi:hypothetical protein
MAALRDTQDALLLELPSSGKLRDTQDVLIFEVAPTAVGHLRDSQDVLIFEINVPPPVSITYPIAPPNLSGIGPQKFVLRMVDVIAETVSQFTGGQQEQQWAGQWWELEMTLPPLTRAQAEPWFAFLAALHGKLGTFQMGDYNAQTPRGTAAPGSAQCSGASNVNGANQLVTKAWTAGATLLAGDYLQMTTLGGPTRLYKNLLDAVADGGGNMTLQIFPNIRETLPDSLAIVTANTFGTFRLSENPRVVEIDRNKVYSISFKAKEAI